MKPGSIISVLYAVVGIGIAVLSSQILGFGPWALAILALGLMALFSPYFPQVFSVTRVLVMIASVLSILAILLVLLAANTGGSFRLPSDQALLLLLFFVFSLLGFVFARIKTAPS